MRHALANGAARVLSTYCKNTSNSGTSNGNSTNASRNFHQWRGENLRSMIPMTTTTSTNTTPTKIR